MTIYASKSTGGFYDSEIHTSIPNDAVAITRELHQSLIRGQSLGKIINFNTVDGVPSLEDPIGPTLEEKQEMAWTAIKTKRDALTQGGGFPVDGKWYHSDTFSRSQHIGMVIMGANLPVGIMWKTMDGTFVEMTPTLAMQVFTAAAVQDQAIFAAAENHRTAMMQAEDPLAYDYSTGWPTTFQATVE